VGVHHRLTTTRFSPSTSCQDLTPEGATPTRDSCMRLASRSAERSLDRAVSMLSVLSIALGVLNAMSFIYFGLCLVLTLTMSSPPPGSGPHQWRQYEAVNAMLSMMVLLNGAMATAIVAGICVHQRRASARKALLVLAPIVILLALANGSVFYIFESEDPSAFTALAVIAWPSILSGLGYSILVPVVLLQRRVAALFS
jgi:hypothetical protein